MNSKSLTNPIRFLGVGDVFLEKLDRKDPFLQVMPFLEQADVKFCNVEAPFTRELMPLQDGESI